MTIINRLLTRGYAEFEREFDELCTLRVSESVFKYPRV
jgi:hypothetical protein